MIKRILTVLQFFLIGAIGFNVYAQDCDIDFSTDIECWYKQRYFPPEGGGILALNQGTKLIIPGGSLNEGTVLWAEVCRYDLEDKTVTSFEFGPPGIQFNSSVSLVLRYFDFPEGPSDVVCRYWDEETSQWLCVQAYHDEGTKTYEFKISHFSLYAVSSNREDMEIELWEAE